MARARVLVVDDKASVLEVLSSMLSPAYDVTTAPEPAAAAALVERERFDVVLTDVRMPGGSGFDLLAAIRRVSPETSVVMMTGYASIPDAVAAIRQGAFDYVAKPLEAEEVALVVARALAHRTGAGAAPDAGAPDVGAPPARASNVDVDFREALIAARDAASRDYLLALMRQFNGNVTRAAIKAGMTRENLHRLLRKYGVRSESFKRPGPGSEQDG